MNAKALPVEEYKKSLTQKKVSLRKLSFVLPKQTVSSINVPGIGIASW